MLKFRSLYEVIDNHERFYSPHGDPYAITYSERHNPATGEWEIFPSGKDYLPDKINQGVSEAMPVNIMKRYELGETGILDQIIGSYVDLTKLPGSLVEAQNQLLNVEDRFMQLDPELRDLFDNNVNIYMRGLESGDTPKKVEQYNKMLHDRKQEIIRQAVARKGVVENVES